MALISLFVLTCHDVSLTHWKSRCSWTFCILPLHCLLGLGLLFRLTTLIGLFYFYIIISFWFLISCGRLSSLSVS